MLGSLATSLPANAVQTPQSTIVSDNPADNTPNVLDGEVDAIVQVGSTVVLGGTFTQVQNAGAATPVQHVSHLVAFDATTGTISTTFLPTLDGAVESLESAGDGTSIYVGGDFVNVDGVPAKSVTRLNLSNGSRVPAFSVAKPDGVVKDMRLVHGQLVIGGTFTKIGNVTRGQLASLNPTTGALTSFVSLKFAGPYNSGILKVSKLDVSPDGSKLLGMGNFQTINGLARSQLFLLNTGGTTSTLSTWQTSFFGRACAIADDTYMRDLDISPDGTYAVVATTGGYGGPLSPCDTTTRWDLTTSAAGLQPMWRDVTGGDTTTAVAITGSAVYTGGHYRWQNNPSGSNTAGPGAVPRQGLAALDPTNGLPLSWNPGRARGVGVFGLLGTSTGLWVGSDTDQVGGEMHGRIAFFPLAGGVTPPANVTGYLPEDVYLLGAANSAPGVSPVTFDDTVDRQFWIGPGSAPETSATPALGAAFGSSRGSFLVDGTVYSGWSDGTFQARSFDGTTLGAPTTVELYGSTFADDIPTITGIVYANYRIYYTLAGDSNLYARAFTPQDQIVGSTRYTVSAAALNASHVAGMFLSGSTLYFADSGTGNLSKVTLTGGSVSTPGTITGPAVLADASIDWRARGAFVWNGTPASRTNTPPTALATSSCVAAACTFNGSGSFDPDGHLVSYAWDFGDGSTGTGAVATHTYVTAGTYTVTLTVTDFEGGTGTTSFSVHPVHSQYTAVSPCRVFDTRLGKGTCTGSPVFAKAKVGPGGTLSVKVTSVGTVPSTATAVVLNVTAVGATAPTYVTASPHGLPRPLASNLNVANGQPTPNLVVVPVGAGGVVDFYNAVGSVDLIADLAGYFSPTSPAFYTASGPCRLFDTRTGAGACSGATGVTAAALGAGKTLSVQVRGVANIPADATAVVMNITGLGATAPTFITAWPSGGPRPTASNLNLHNGSAVPNLAFVPIGSDGKISLYNDQGSVQLIGDIAGYYSPSSPAGYTPVTPCRVFDTRTGAGSCSNAPSITAGTVGPGATLSIDLTDVAGVPSTATAVVLNVTAVNATAPTFVTVWPDGGPPPLASNLNVSSALPVPNLVVVPIGSDGMIDFYNQAGKVNLLADIAGYYSP